MLRTELRTDSGGAGAFRGGLGLSREYQILSGEVVFTHRGERHAHPARGSLGGGDGALAVATLHRAGGAVEEIRSKTVTRLAAGDRIEIHTAGGGGYGDPAARSAERLAADRANRKVGDGSNGRSDP